MVQDAKERHNRAIETRATDEQLVPSPGDREWLLLVSRLVALSDAARARTKRLAERLTRQQELSAALAAAATPLDVANALFERLLPDIGASAANLGWLGRDGTLETIHSVGYGPEATAEMVRI